MIKVHVTKTPNGIEVEATDTENGYIDANYYEDYPPIEGDWATWFELLKEYKPTGRWNNHRME